MSRATPYGVVLLAALAGCTPVASLASGPTPTISAAPDSARSDSSASGLDAAPEAPRLDTDLQGSSDSTAAGTANRSEREETDEPVHWPALAAGGAAMAGATVVFQVHQTWWPRRRSSFRFQNDWAYVRSADKAGHATAGYLLARAYRGPLRWAGMDDTQAADWAAGVAWGQLLFHEAFDGFNPIQGFSVGDLAANTVGVGLAWGQSRVPALEAVSMKVSYWPSDWSGRSPIDDYAGQVYWLAANPHRLARGTVGRALPPWLNVAVGYGARTPVGPNTLGTSLAYVGLDVDLGALPFHGPVWDAVRPWLRYVHVPAPAIRIVPDVGLDLFAY